jgi:hypothetical protein
MPIGIYPGPDCRSGARLLVASALQAAWPDGLQGRGDAGSASAAGAAKV